MALTRMPFGPSCTATLVTKPITPAFAAAYAVRPWPTMAAMEETQVIAPPRFSIAGTAAWVASSIDLRSIAITRSHSSSVVSMRSRRDSTPTLLCRMSSPPHRLTTWLTMRLQSAARVTSAPNASAVPPSAAIIFTVSSARPTSASTHSTFAPSRANRIALALPLPRPGPREPAPVTIATLSFSRPAMAPSCVPERRARRPGCRCDAARSSRPAPRCRARRGLRCRSGGFGRFFLVGLLVGLLRGLALVVALRLGRRCGSLLGEHHQRHRRVVAVAEADLEDAQVAAVALGEARPEIVEQLLDDRAIAQPVEGNQPVGSVRLLPGGDNRPTTAATL